MRVQLRDQIRRIQLTTGTTTVFVITSAFSDAIVFGILIIVLLVKPSGLMGEPESEKV